jgi:putative flavoprotein involved in K+ transport
VATGAYQKPYIPIFAAALNPTIFQVHSAAYCNPQQVPAQNVLVVGAGNSGAEIGLELARAGKHVWLAGRDVGSIPADRFGRILGGRPYWFILSRLLSINTPVGRKMRDNVFRHGTPLIRLNRQVVTEAGIENAPRVKDVVSGQPQMEDGHLLPVDGVVWATGFRPDYSWIDMPIFDESSYPRHQRGVVPEAPGLYFTGLPFQTALSSALLGGTGPDAEYIVRKIS